MSQQQLPRLFFLKTCWVRGLIYWLRLCDCAGVLRIMYRQHDVVDTPVAFTAPTCQDLDVCPSRVRLNVCVEEGEVGEFERSVEEVLSVRIVYVCVCKSLRAGSGGPAGSLWLHCALWVSGLAQILCTATAGRWVPTKLELPDTHMYKHGYVGLDRKSKRETVYMSLCLIWVVLCCVRLGL